MKIIWSLLILAISLLACQPNKSKLYPAQNELAQKLDSIGHYFINQGKTGAISISVVQHDSVLYNNAFGYANIEKKIPITTSHCFNMASISKLVGTAIVMKLVEEGKLNLDQTLFDLLPEFPRDDQAQKITLRQLLNHTSGIIDYAIEIDTLFMESGVPPTQEDIMRFFAKEDLLFTPGTYHAYTNSGFKLMEYIIEKATGQKYSNAIDRIINEPTGLDFKLLADRMNAPNLTESLDYTDTTLNQEPYWSWISGDGGLTATAENLARFAQKWSDGTIISETSFREMITRTRLNSGIETGYGLGTRTGYFEGEYCIGHTGGNKSTIAMMMYFPDKDISVAVFDNTDGSPTSAMHVMGPVALAILGKDEPKHRNNLVLPEDSISYVGIYDMYGYVVRAPDRFKVYYDSKDQHFYRKYDGSDRKGQKLIALGNDLFATDPYVMDRVEFVRNEDGEVVAYRNYWNGLFQRMGFKRQN